MGPVAFRKLVEFFGSPARVLDGKPGDFRGLGGLPRKVIENVVEKKYEKDPEKEFAEIDKRGIKIVCLKDDVYPKNLALIHDPPPVIFVKGTLSVKDVISVAVVGSRAASYQGVRFTKNLCADLASHGVTVVSGFARGIDTAAHMGCLDGGGRTLAVLGCGLDVDYPKQNRELRWEIEKQGALISEFPLGTEPESRNFPARNRIISGLSLGVVVVEAGRRSGSLITARIALEQDREVFAVPGSVTNYRSLGPNWLIKQGAKLVETAKDIVDELAPMLREPTSEVGSHEERPRSMMAVPSDLVEEEKDILNLLEVEPMLFDDMARALEWDTGTLASILSRLELKGLVKQLPGKYFGRV